MSDRSPILIVPGLDGSGPGHWQTLWESSYPRARRAAQRDWEAARCSEWVEGLHGALASSGPDTILVAHSLGCALVAHWARARWLPVRGALLVAPADVERPGFPARAEGFAPLPLGRLPFPSTVVAGTNDPVVTLERARHFAERWGSQLVALEAVGHLNLASGHGPWPEGLRLLRELEQHSADRPLRRAV